MAIDSRDKRAAAIAAGLPWMVITPISDGSIDADDRAIIAHMYPVGAGEAVDTAVVRIGMTLMERLTMMELMPY